MRRPAAVPAGRVACESVLTTVLLFLVVTMVRWARAPASPLYVGAPAAGPRLDGAGGVPGGDAGTSSSWRSPSGACRRTRRRAAGRRTRWAAEGMAATHTTAELLQGARQEGRQAHGSPHYASAAALLLLDSDGQVDTRTNC
ncbi:hypothetical protein ABZV75_11015 [Streptomyces flaveolus]|uniref:hypothetical protein n=1 Tax=Streptomyces flaveolus TaxID=67297 RepID=UPI0033A9537C